MNSAINVVERYDYAPFGEELTAGIDGRTTTLLFSTNQYPTITPDSTTDKFTGKERDSETGLDYFGARYLSGAQGRFTSPDAGNAHPASPQSWNRYTYAANNPLAIIDPDGREPVKAQAGLIQGFILQMNSTTHHVGAQSGAQASAALLSLGETKFSWKRGLVPANTAVFNQSSDRYVYTQDYGWVDMVHFLFYAGRAYMYKTKGDANPEGSAVKEGYRQEAVDRVADSWSAYSYEDLPSDQLGATFGAFVFDPSSKLSLGAQIQAFLVSLGATDPHAAPNYAALPDYDSRKPPMERNTTTNPMFTTSHPVDEERDRQCGLGNSAACR